MFCFSKVITSHSDSLGFDPRGECGLKCYMHCIPISPCSLVLKQSTSDCLSLCSATFKVLGCSAFLLCYSLHFSKEHTHSGCCLNWRGHRRQGEFLAAVVIETRCDEVPYQDTKRRPCRGGGGKASKRYTRERMHRTQDPLDLGVEGRDLKWHWLRQEINRKEEIGEEGEDLSLRCSLSKLMGSYKPWGLECHWIYEPGAWRGAISIVDIGQLTNTLEILKQAYPFDLIHSWQATKGRLSGINTHLAQILQYCYVNSILLCLCMWSFTCMTG